MYLPEQFAVTADVEGVNVPPAWLGIVPVILLPFTHAVFRQEYVRPILYRASDLPDSLQSPFRPRYAYRLESLPPIRLPVRRRPVSPVHYRPGQRFPVLIHDYFTGQDISRASRYYIRSGPPPPPLGIHIFPMLYTPFNPTLQSDAGFLYTLNVAVPFPSDAVPLVIIPNAFMYAFWWRRSPHRPAH